MILVLAGVIAGVTIMNKAPAPSGELIQEVERSVFPVETVKVGPRTVAETLNRTGVLQADKDVTLNAQVAGTVKKVDKRLGDACAKGEAVVRLDPESYRIGVSQAGAALKQAKVALEQAERNLARIEKLKRKEVASEQQYDTAATGVEASKAALDQARAAQRAAAKGLKDTKVKCPFDGTVARTMVEVGQSVGPAVPVARIVDTEKLKLVIEVPARQLSMLRLGQRVTLTAPSAAGGSIEGEISRIGVAANERTRTFPVEILAANGGELRPGQVVNADCELQIHREALLVPVEALLDEQGEASELMVIEDGAARTVRVDLGARIGNEIIVKSGLSPGDEVITVGHETLKDGAPVKPVNAKK